MACLFGKLRNSHEKFAHVKRHPICHLPMIQCHVSPVNFVLQPKLELLWSCSSIKMDTYYCILGQKFGIPSSILGDNRFSNNHLIKSHQNLFLSIRHPSLDDIPLVTTFLLRFCDHNQTTQTQDEDHTDSGTSYSTHPNRKWHYITRNRHWWLNHDTSQVHVCNEWDCIVSKPGFQNYCWPFLQGNGCFQNKPMFY